MKSIGARQRPKVIAGVGIVALLFAVYVAAIFEDRASHAKAVDSARSAKAFLKASQVLLHPRCVNCHPAGDSPLFGDQSRPHPMHVVRGPEGIGKNGVWCSTCHQDKNLPGAHMPPGSPGWQLPPADMPMVFEKKTAGELCRQMKDPAQNGERSIEEENMRIGKRSILTRANISHASLPPRFS